MKYFTSIFVVIFIIFISLTIYLILEDKVFRKSQPVKKKALKQGYGYYAPEKSLGCQTPNQKCTEQGTETTIQYCVPNPTTGKGCLDSSGNISYNSIIRKKPCQTQCVQNQFFVTEGIQLLGSNNSGTDVYPVIGSGCNRIVDKKLGIDYTDRFFGTYDASKGTYEKKTCIPSLDGVCASQYSGYYQKIYNSKKSDGKGTFGTTYACGVDKGVLQLTGLVDAKKSGDLINYYPVEFDETGQIRHVCYDINGVDQIEILNTTKEIPQNFVYPNKCYKNLPVFNTPAELWPTKGDDALNFFQSFGKVSSTQQYFGISSGQFNQLLGVSVIKSDYSLNRDYNSYIDLRIGDELAICDKILENKTNGVGLQTGINIASKIVYLALVGGIPYDATGYYFDSWSIPQSSELNSKNPTIGAGLEYPGGENFYIPRADGGVFFPYAIEPKVLNSVIVTDASDTGCNVLIEGEGTTNKFIYLQENKTGEFGFFLADLIPGFKNTYSISYTNQPYKLKNKVYTGYLISEDPNYFGDGSINLFTPDGFQNQVSFDYSKSFISSCFMTQNLISIPQNSTQMENFSKSLQIRTNLSEVDEYAIFATLQGDTRPRYHWPLEVYTTGIPNLVSFLEYPKLVFNYTGTSQSSDWYYPEGMLNFHDETGFSTCSYDLSIYPNYQKDSAGNGVSGYFITNLETITPGHGYPVPSGFNIDRGQIYWGFCPIYSRDFFSSNMNYNGIDFVSQINVIYYNYLNSNTVNSIFSSPKNSVNGINDSTRVLLQELRYLKAIRTSSQYFIVNIAQTPVVYRDGKIHQYLEIIRNQVSFNNLVEKSNIVIGEEKTLTLTADFSVFKSPYTINNKGEYNFVCYDERGVPLEKGTQIQIPTDESLIVNLSCNDYNINNKKNVLCGIAGLPDISGNITPCTQKRTMQLVNFDDACPVLDIGEYMSLGNLLEDGLITDGKELKTGPEFGKPIDNQLQMPPIFFIRDLVNGKNYKPGNEFFLDRTKIDYFVSLINNNTNFVTNLDAWKRVFVYKNLTFNTVYQNLFVNIPPENSINSLTNSDIAIPNTQNNPNFTFKNKTYSSSSGINIQSEVSNSGLGVTDYYRGGVQSYYGHPLKPCFGSIKSEDQKISLTRINGFQWGSTQGYDSAFGQGGFTVAKKLTMMFVDRNYQIQRVSITLLNTPTKTPNQTINAWMAQFPQIYFTGAVSVGEIDGHGPSVECILDSFLVLSESGSVMADVYGPRYGGSVLGTGNGPGYGIQYGHFVAPWQGYNGLLRNQNSKDIIKKYYGNASGLLNSEYAFTDEGSYYVINIGKTYYQLYNTGGDIVNEQVPPPGFDLFPPMVENLGSATVNVPSISTDSVLPAFVPIQSDWPKSFDGYDGYATFQTVTSLTRENTLASFTGSWWSANDIVKLQSYGGEKLSAIYYNPGYRTNILSNSLSRRSKNYVNTMSRYTGSGVPDVFTNADLNSDYSPSFTGKVFGNIDQSGFYDYFNPNFTGVKGQTPNRVEFKISQVKQGKKILYSFTSRFYDDKLGDPWSDVEVGDYFVPDNNYFNSFYHCFLTSPVESGVNGFNLTNQYYDRDAGATETTDLGGPGSFAGLQYIDETASSSTTTDFLAWKNSRDLGCFIPTTEDFDAFDLFYGSGSETEDVSVAWRPSSSITTLPKIGDKILISPKVQAYNLIDFNQNIVYYNYQINRYPSGEPQDPPQIFTPGTLEIGEVTNVDSDNNKITIKRNVTSSPQSALPNQETKPIWTGMRNPVGGSFFETVTDTSTIVVGGKNSGVFLFNLGQGTGGTISANDFVITDMSKNSTDSKGNWIEFNFTVPSLGQVYLTYLYQQTVDWESYYNPNVLSLLDVTEVSSAGNGYFKSIPVYQTSMKIYNDYPPVFSLDNYPINYFNISDVGNPPVNSFSMPILDFNIYIATLSAKYIKQEFTPSYQKIDTNSYAVISDETGDSFNPLSYVTEVYFDENTNYFYFNEFRRLSLELELKSLSYQVNDTIEYNQFSFLQSATGTSVVTGNLLENSVSISPQNILVNHKYTSIYFLKIVETNTSVVFSETDKVYKTYDYKCLVLNGNGTDLWNKSSIITEATGQERYVPYGFNSGEDQNYIYYLPWGRPWTCDTDLDATNTISNLSLTGVPTSSASQINLFSVNPNSDGGITPTRVNKSYGSTFTDIGVSDIMTDDYMLSQRYWGPNLSDGPGDFIRSGNLDVVRLVSTTLQNISDPSQEVSLNVESIVGKPFGSYFFLSQAEPDQVPGEMGGSYITQFSIEMISTSSVGTHFKSSTGLGVKIVDTQPGSYIYRGSKTSLQPIENFDNNSEYSTNEVVSLQNRNLRQYYRNNTNGTIVGSGENLHEFEIVPEIFNPQQDYFQLLPDIYYNTGESVVTTENGVSFLFKANEIVKGTSPPPGEEWSLVELDSDLTDSTGSNFFTETVTDINNTDEMVNVVINTRDLDNQSLPLAVKTTQGPDVYCPQSCTYYPSSSDLGVSYGSSTNFTGIDIYDNIRDLFVNPQVLRIKDENQKYISLGNVPVGDGTNFNLNYLSDTGDSDELVSQNIYFVDLSNFERERFGKDLCIGDLTIYDKEGLSYPSSGLSTFDFSNSITFQFLPNSVNSQDFVSWKGVSYIGVSALYQLEETGVQFNIFPKYSVDGTADYLDFGINGIEGIPIPYLDTTGHYGSLDFSSISVKTTFIISNSPKNGNQREITLNGIGGGSVTIYDIKYGNTINPLDMMKGFSGPTPFWDPWVSTRGTSGYELGDIWYVKNGSGVVVARGFLIPLAGGGIFPGSFVLVGEVRENLLGLKVEIISKNGTGYVSPVLGDTSKNIIDFKVRDSGTITPDLYTDSGFLTDQFGSELFSKFTIYVNTGIQGPIQPNQFQIDYDTGSGPSIQNIYSPSYDITKKIKVKASGIFGTTFLGNLAYSPGNISTDYSTGTSIMSSIFQPFRNDIFLNSEGGKLFKENKVSQLDNISNVLFLEHNGGTSFSLYANPFDKPISNRYSQLITGITQFPFMLTEKLGVVTSESIEQTYSETFSGIEGVSIPLKFSQMASSPGDTYNPTKGEIPGQTTVQLQLQEMKQNRTYNYIENRNNCSIYFNPLFKPNITTPVNGGTLEVLVNPKLPLYNNNTQARGNRFDNEQTNIIKFTTSNYNGNPSEYTLGTTTLTLGVNLSYSFTQDDSSNNGFPLVFGTNGTSINTGDIMSPATKYKFYGESQYFVISYFINGISVTKEGYLSKYDGSTTRSRRVTLRYRSDYGTCEGVSPFQPIFYGTNEKTSSGDPLSIGGKIVFINH